MNCQYFIILSLAISIYLMVYFLYFKSDMKGKKEKESFIPVVKSDLFPGTYWRNNSQRQSDHCDIRPPQALDVEYRAPVASPSSFGQDSEEYKRLPVRYPEPRFQMVCSVNDHLQRKCFWKKVYKNYY